MNRPSLLPPNSTKLERSVEQVSARADDIDVIIASLWNPDTCDVQYLGFLAWALSVDVWDDRWSEDVKRAVVRESMPIHRQKGTIGAVRRALRSIGVDIDISEWFEHSGDPHTFRLDLYAQDLFAGGLGINIRFLNQVQRAIEHVKPVRSRYHVRIGDRHDSHHYSRSGVRASVRHRAIHDPTPRISSFASSSSYRAGMRSRIRSMVSHDILRQGIA